MSPAGDRGFAQRTRRYLEAAARAARTWYDDDGVWRTPGKPLETRERLWLSFALYGTGDRALADAVIRRGDSPRYGDVLYNIFDTNIAVALLVHHGERMAADVRAKLERLARDGFSFKPGNRQPDYQFHGYNDNMPAKATLGLILGGERLGCTDAVEYGVWNLRQLRAMLVRNGINSEYNSPTYSPLTVHAMAEIAESANHPEARALAAGIEERLWMDVAARFHPETGVLAGPYSRAYTVDTLASTSCAAAWLWFVLGDAARPSPMLFFDPPADLVVHHAGDYPFNIAQMCWFAAAWYHVPPAARRLFKAKRYPFEAVATCEQGDAGPDFPARPCRIASYLTEDFTLGTASTPFCGGEQTMSYFVTYRRKAPVGSFRDVGTVFSKMVINGERPGRIEQPAAPDGTPYANRGECDCLVSHANTLTVQQAGTALVLTHPYLALGGPADAAGIVRQAAAKPLTELRELVVFPSHYGGSDQVRVGGRTRAEWDGEVPRGHWVACRRGRLLIGVRPLVYTRALGEPVISLERAGNYECLGATFHRGAARLFTRAELRHVFGGFVAEHASVDEFASLDEFAAWLETARFTDYFWTTRRVRYRRPEGRGRPALEIEVSWSPGSHDPRVAAVNGRRVEWPTVAMGGLRTSQLPFLGEPFTPVPPFFPWQDFRVEWGDWPYAIGDREG